MNLARRFVEAFRRDPREGYAGGFYAFLQEVTSGDEFLQRIRPDSDKSGAAMRAGPLGVFPTIGEVVEPLPRQGGPDARYDGRHQRGHGLGADDALHALPPGP